MKLCCASYKPDSIPGLEERNRDTGTGSVLEGGGRRPTLTRCPLTPVCSGIAGPAGVLHAAAWSHAHLPTINTSGTPDST